MNVHTEISPLARMADKLVEAGYGDHLITVLPPNVQYLKIKGGVAELEISDGKPPGKYENGRWSLLAGWRTSQQFATAANIEALKNWPDVGIGLRGGAILLFDFDFYSAEGDQKRREGRLLDELLALLAETLKVSVADLATRARSNAPSIMVFVRAANGDTRKRGMAFRLGNATCRIEILGNGQQGVIAGHHESGVDVETNLHRHPFNTLPTLSEAGMDTLWEGFADLVKRHGGTVTEETRTSGGFTLAEPLDVKTAVMRALGRPRESKGWMAEAGIFFDETHNHGEIRADPEHLYRNLEEGISIYADGGIRDHGTRRSHDAISFLREMCVVTEDGGLDYAPPEYRPENPGDPEAPWSAEKDKQPRPTEPQAIRWLCRAVGGIEAPEDVTLADGLPLLARPLGLDIDAMRRVFVSHWHQSQDGSTWDPSRWDRDTIERQKAVLPALQAVFPTSFAQWKRDWLEQLEIDVDPMIEAERKAVIEGRAESQKTAKNAFPTAYRNPDPATITPTDFIYGKIYVRGHLSATYAASKIGKSGLVIAEGLAMASNKPLLDIQPNGPQRVWLFSGEDPMDRLEMLIEAAKQHYGLTSEDLGGRLFVDSGMTEGASIKLARATREGIKLLDDQIKIITDAIQRCKIDVLSLDPLISFHELPENDNTALDMLAKRLARCAGEHHFAAHLAHHIRKPAPNQKGGTSLNDGRGGGALLAATRSVRALDRMTVTEAGKLRITDERLRLSCFRMTDAATNLAPPPEVEKHWWRHISVRVANGDNIGVVQHVGSLADLAILGDPVADEPEPWREAVLTELEEVKWRDDQRAGMWSGKLFARCMGLNGDDPEDKGAILERIGAWKKLGLVQSMAVKDEKTRKWFQYLVRAQKPGGEG